MNDERKEKIRRDAEMTLAPPADPSWRDSQEERWQRVLAHHCLELLAEVKESEGATV